MSLGNQERGREDEGKREGGQQEVKENAVAGRRVWLGRDKA